MNFFLFKEILLWDPTSLLHSVLKMKEAFGKEVYCRKPGLQHTLSKLVRQEAMLRTKASLMHKDSDELAAVELEIKTSSPKTRAENDVHVGTRRRLDVQVGRTIR